MPKLWEPYPKRSGHYIRRIELDTASGEQLRHIVVFYDGNDRWWWYNGESTVYRLGDLTETENITYMQIHP